MITSAIVPQISTVINGLIEECHAAAGLILTEDDMKCRLFGALLRLPELQGNFESADRGIFTSTVHSEVSWFDEENRLSIKPDITIIDPELLSVLHPMQPGVPFPRKGFHFNGNAVVIELKFFRGTSGVSRRCVPSIKKDIDKIRRLVRKANEAARPSFVFGFVVVFSKYNKTCPEFEQLRADVSDVRVIYGTTSIASGEGVQ